MEVRQRAVKMEEDHEYQAMSVQSKVVLTEKANSWSNGVEKINVKKREEGYCLLDYHSLPDYLQDNEYILGHYRADLTYRQAVTSLFKLHNETVNIWTHLLGFFFFLWLTVLMVMDLWELRDPLSSCFWGKGQDGESFQHCLLQVMEHTVIKIMEPMLNRTTRWPFFVFMGGSMFCLLASSVCHLFTCHSRPVAILLMRIDYAGLLWVSIYF